MYDFDLIALKMNKNPKEEKRNLRDNLGTNPWHAVELPLCRVHRHRHRYCVFEMINDIVRPADHEEFDHRRIDRSRKTCPKIVDPESH